ncbi:MAG: four helix bundle protein [Patescibacteria group bacterium]
MANEEVKQKIKKFTDLVVWQQARGLAKQTYNVAMVLPPEERYGLASQMKRAAVSVASNIAEGFKRDTMKDKIRFYVQAHGSLTELQNQIIIGNDVGLIEDDMKNGLLQFTDRVDALLTGLIRASKERL